MTMTPYVIFDLDGVIVSTDAFHYKAWKKMANEENLPFDETLNHQLRGVSRMASLEIILKNAGKEGAYTDEEKIAMTDRKNRYYQSLLDGLDESHLLPRALHTLDALKEKSIPCAVASSSKNAKRIIDALNLNDAFEVIVDGTMIANSKPHPEVFQKARDLLGAKTEACYVIEDAVSGIEAAKAAGMKAVAVGDARKSPVADHKLEMLDELLEILD